MNNNIKEVGNGFLFKFKVMTMLGGGRKLATKAAKRRYWYILEIEECVLCGMVIL